MKQRHVQSGFHGGQEYKNEARKVLYAACVFFFVLLAVTLFDFLVFQ